ncbi:AAA family ATPase, partial [Streptomyces umbrinus]
MDGAGSGPSTGPGPGAGWGSGPGSGQGERPDDDLSAGGPSDDRPGNRGASHGGSGGGGASGGEAAWPTGPGDIRDRLEKTGYLVDDGLAVACFLALKLRRPIFCEGDAGVGKTSLASALAAALDAPLIRLQCYEGIDASQALYDWDFPRQLL